MYDTFDHCFNFTPCVYICPVEKILQNPDITGVGRYVTKIIIVEV